ncbi:ESPR-type extended signal peptide-containing protein [Actinobacillus pleuropneumoniae]|uniref:Autotransporter adhesin n=1 Tax=Actinobacillus pleuropneumoniae serotype 7 (strain AP76) TaxID=537457 RepID=B3GX18_ACTP7|nr:ESPR-type extended signal peptide-containing protein [Actinobacillus pleuropneumoniae]ACE61170.1 autotransporter adhesin [Actinobacillus pleuropneumoniae serovar 7 str. AP76]
MNKIFKVIWSHATQTFVVVSELTRSKSKAKASVSDVKKSGVSSLITSGFKLSAISSLLISAMPSVYAAVAISSTGWNTVDTSNVQATGNGIAIGSNAGKQQSDGYTSNNSAEATRNAYHLQNIGGSASNNTISLGTNAYAGGEDSVAIGTRAQAVHNVQTTNMAYNSRGSYNAGAVAIGFQSIARGDQTVALGSRAAAYNRQATAIGNDSYAMGVGSVVIGGDDSGYAYESINGTGKQAWANNSGNLGYTNLATGFNPSKEPNKADYRPSAASGNGATVVGVHSQALSKGSTALGVAATAGDGGKISSTIKDGQIVGIDSTQNIEATAIGALAHAQFRNTTAVGHAAKAIGEYSTSIGDDAAANGKNSSAVGKSATANGEFAIAIGNAESNNVEGTKTQANGTRAIAIGTSAKSLANNTISIGSKANTSIEGAVALGANSESNRQLNAAETTNPYVPATANQSEANAIKATVATTGAVSIGKDGVRRQITNLAAGTADTDAVNVAQLKTAVDTWNVQENGSQKKVINNRDNVNFANGTGTTATVGVDSAGKSAIVKYSVNQSGLNVATDGKVTAVTNGNNFATAEQIADAINKSEKTTVVNGNTEITATPKVNGTVTTYDLALSEKTVNDIKQGTTALQEIETTADGVKAQTIKKDSNKANFTSGKNIKLTPSDKGIEVATKDDVDFTTVNATTVNGDTIKSGNVVINKNGINAGNQKITNVAKGTEDSDAVNYSHLNCQTKCNDFLK